MVTVAAGSVAAATAKAVVAKAAAVTAKAVVVKVVAVMAKAVVATVVAVRVAGMAVGELVAARRWRRIGPNNRVKAPALLRPVGAKLDSWGSRARLPSEHNPS